MITRVNAITDDGMEFEITKTGVYFKSGGHVDADDMALIDCIKKMLEGIDVKREVMKILNIKKG